MDTLQELEQEQIKKLVADSPVPEFGPGDTVRVKVKVIEGTRERVQAFEGVCIARKNAGINSNFTVRKISYGEGVERVFPLYSPRIAGIEVVRRGAVRRAKLYYLRGRRGKSARIAERVTPRESAAGQAPAAAPAGGETAAEESPSPAGGRKMNAPRTLVDKIWDSHVVENQPHRSTVLHIQPH